VSAKEVKHDSCILLLLLVAGVLAAQEPRITPNTTIDSAMLELWLHSGDPRLIAWSADFTRRTPDPKILAEMPILLVHWNMPPAYSGDETQAAQRRAIFAILDALIQTNAVVPIPAINAIAPNFPVQAAILIARHPLAESRTTLGDWTLGSTGPSAKLLARIASMMLATDPKGSQSIWNGDTMGFVASVVAASEAALRITVSSTNTVEELGITGTCGDAFGHDLSSGWPVVYAYDLLENDPQTTTPVLIELDGDRIVSRRTPENGGWGNCYGVKWLDPTTRHRLIAHWLGVAEKDVSWQPLEPFTIVWAGKADYERQLGAIIESQREKLRATVETLQQRGFLTEGEAARVAPRLIIVVQCDMNPCPLD
jgi:hypothetical protein